MVDPIKLKTRAVLVQESVIARLEEALVEARSGELVAVAIAGVLQDGALRTSWSDSNNFGLMLGSVCRLENRLNANMELNVILEPDDG